MKLISNALINQMHSCHAPLVFTLTKSRISHDTNHHGGNSKGTTCIVDRDVTAYLVVDRVLRLPTGQYGCRYGGHPGFNDF